MIRTVLFIDPPAFCTTVEGLVAPALRSRPVVVAAPGADRATVLALSFEARRAGITRGMPVAQARKRCPDLIIRPPNPQLYARASRALDEILRRYAPVIEPKGYGHAYLDLTGTSRLFGPAVDVAQRIQRESSDRLGLPLAVGGAQNKLVSEAAATIIKGRGGDVHSRGGDVHSRGGDVHSRGGDVHSRGGAIAPPLLTAPPLLIAPPLHDCLLDIPIGTEARFLAPHEVTLLPELDPRMRERLDDYQLDRIGEVQAISERELALVFGTAGRLLHHHAMGIDPRPVLPPSVKAEFRAAHTLGDDSNDLALLHRILRHLTERLGSRLRARHLVARRLTVHLAYSDYATAKRSVPIGLAALDVELWHAARRGFALARDRTVALRAVGVSVDRFLEADLQLDLWNGGTMMPGRGGATAPPPLDPLPDMPSHDERPTALQSAVDRIRGRWGVKGLRVGR